MQPEPLPPPTADLAAAVVGLWRLVSREDYDRSGRRLIDPVLGADPLGLLAFSATRFAAQFSRRDRGAPAADAARQATAAGPAVPGANNSAAADGYDAYFGSHTVDACAGLVTVHLEGSIVPANVGLTLTRELRVAGNRLYIRLETNTPDGVPITRTLTFERG
ncbi:MAG TPA: lipocalin-like domain-containing protein [Candidatus Eisenbacteria bacterium]|nr:lipocalin-like domain-containing protein [Candidatus Eisenbacteria bacterium]